MTRRPRLSGVPVLLAMVALCFAGASKANDGDVRPSVVFILVDDLRFDDLGYAGHPFARTPHVDRLAAEGLNFVNAFATTPLCSPSRACILTGLHARAHGIIDNTDRSAASHKLDTFPKRLHDAGYRTAYVGKWHMGNDASPRPGFDRWVCLPGQGESNDPPLNIDGMQTKESGYVTDVLTTHAVDFIRAEKDSGKPLMLYVAHKALHPQTQQGPDGKLSDPAADNFVPAERHKDLYENNVLPRRPNYAKPPLDKPALMQVIDGLKPLGAETVSSDRAIKGRLRMLAAVDESTGKIVDALRETGRLDDTLVVFTSDHGYFYGEHGLSTERRLAYEESIRIPLVMRLPKLTGPPRKIDQTVLTLDFAATFLELAKAERPARLHGMSLVPHLTGEKRSRTSRDFLIEYWSDTVFPRMNKMGYAAVRAECGKYIRYAEHPGADELYNLALDPYELENRAGKPEAAETIEMMKVRLTELIEQAKK